MSGFQLPEPWYYSVDELANDWGVHRDRIHYYMDAGLILPSVRVERSRLTCELPCQAPHVIAVLEEFANLVWQEGSAWITGAHRCSQTDGTGFKSFAVEFEEPVRIARQDLVIPTDQREAMEAHGRRQNTNPVERRSLLKIIATMASKGYGMDLTNHYSDAQMLRKDADLCGIDISVETIAQKLVEARQYLSSNAG